MKQRADEEWDEFHDPGVVDWKRVRASIEHENTLVNHRVGWLLTSQLFLFGAFAAVFNAAINKDVLATSLHVQVFLLAVSCVAITICLFVMVSLDAAHRQIGMLEDWWIRQHLVGIKSQAGLRNMRKQSDHPPINGMFDQWLYSVFGVRWLPLPILVGWLGLLTSVFFEYVVKSQQPLLPTVLSTLVLFMVGKGIFWLLEIQREHKRPWHRAVSQAPGSARSQPASPPSGELTHPLKPADAPDVGGESSPPA